MTEPSERGDWWRGDWANSFEGLRTETKVILEELVTGDPEQIIQEGCDARREGASEVCPGPREPRIELEGKYEESEKRVKVRLQNADRSWQILQAEHETTTHLNHT